jgi:hypothetical protein
LTHEFADVTRAFSPVEMHAFRSLFAERNLTVR